MTSGPAGLLVPADRDRLEAITFDPAATVAFNEVTGCLAWSDEIPDGLSPAGREIVRDLLAARGLIHRGVPAEEWDRGSTVRMDLWNAALASGLRWNGFRRIVLTREQRALLERHLADTSLP